MTQTIQEWCQKHSIAPPSSITVQQQTDNVLQFRTVMQHRLLPQPVESVWCSTKKESHRLAAEETMRQLDLVWPSFWPDSMYHMAIPFDMLTAQYTNVKVEVVSSSTDVWRWLKQHTQPGQVLGWDTETSLEDGQVALVQLASVSLVGDNTREPLSPSSIHGNVLLVDTGEHIHPAFLVGSIVQMCRTRGVQITGVNAAGECEATRPHVTDIGHTVAAKHGLIQEIGIRGMAQHILGWQITKPKQVSTSNWRRRTLTPQQKSYAVWDAVIPAVVHLRHMCYPLLDMASVDMPSKS